MNANAQALQDPLLQWVTFKLGDEAYGIDVMRVQEVLRMADIAPVPGAPDYLRGNVVTVLDTRKRFGLPPAEPTDTTRIVIIEANSLTVGILVDSVAEVVNLRSSQIETTPGVGSDESARYIQGVFSDNDEILILVDVNKLLSTDEWSDVSAL